MPVPEKLDEDYLAFVRLQGCMAQWLPGAANCMSGGAEPHHIDGKGMGGSKRDDRLTVPLCRGHHHEFHSRGQVGELTPSATLDVFRSHALGLLLAYMDQGQPSKIFHQPEEAF